MKLRLINRQHLSWAILFFYMIPLLFFASYSIGMMSRTKSWFVLSSGLLLIVACSFVLILILSYWEQSTKKQLPHTQTINSDEDFFDYKETKVTSIEISSNLASENSISEYGGSQNSNKELSLLEALDESQKQNNTLMEENERLNQSLYDIIEENKTWQAQAEKAIQDLEDYKLFSEEQLKQKQLQTAQLQQMIDDQRSEMETRQDQIQLLDTKVHDLSYEIKTLLHLNDVEPELLTQTISLSNNEEIDQNLFKETHPEIESSISKPLFLNNSFEPEIKFEQPIKTASEANGLLKKCLLSAQKLMGANYNHPEALRYREFSTSHYTIDQRRLFDMLRGEDAGLIIVYSPKDGKVLFANQVAKTLLGWNPDKFASDFPLIIQEGMTYWKKALSLLTSTSESQARLLAKTKQGQEALLNCHLGVIASGLFRGYVIGVLYPA